MSVCVDLSESVEGVGAGGVNRELVMAARYDLYSVTATQIEHRLLAPSTHIQALILTPCSHPPPLTFMTTLLSRRLTT